MQSMVTAYDYPSACHVGKPLHTVCVECLASEESELTANLLPPCLSLSLCLSLCLSVSLSLCLYVSLSLCLYASTSFTHLDRADINILLVGDSVAMVSLGHSNTLPVTVDEMLHHCRATSRGAEKALIVGDLPFGSYERSPEDAYSTALRFLKEGNVDAVKLEGGKQRAETVRKLVDGGIAVMGHVGLTPQSISVLGGFRAQGRTAEAATQVLEDALALQDAGAFAVVLECVPPEVGAVVTEALSIPTIGIGAVCVELSCLASLSRFPVSAFVSPSAFPSPSVPNCNSPTARTGRTLLGASTRLPRSARHDGTPALFSGDALVLQELRVRRGRHQQCANAVPRGGRERGVSRPGD